MSHISDWPTLYHLSSARANLLRPVAGRLQGKSVLEIGAGCGAITRYLGECAATVVAVEGSARRAGICAARCRGLDNVTVVRDSFQTFPRAARFDVVTLIGVLEYSRLFTDAENAVTAMVAECRERLSDDGLLIIAIENQLGLKYLAGAPEDHIPRAFFGVNDLYSNRTPVTFGRTELLGILRRAGLPYTEVFAPFPDYKLPSLVVHENAFSTNTLDLASIIRSLPAQAQAFPYQRTFSEEMSWPVFLRNGLGLEMANSFLILAKQRAAGSASEARDADLWIYSTERRRCFAKEKTITARPQGVAVSVRPVYADSPPPGPYQQVLVVDERYIAGQVFASSFYPVVNRPGWTFEDVADWARPWVEWLASLGNGEVTRDALVPAQFLDAVPRNVIVTSAGEFVPFDLEWRAPSDLPLGYMVHRGLLSVFRQLNSVAPPGEGPRRYSRRHGIPRGALNEIVSRIAAHVGFSSSRAFVRDYLYREQMFQQHVLGMELARASRPAAGQRISIRSGTVDDVSAKDLVWEGLERLRGRLMGRP
jgi:SAM-dependent methyltransferase